MTIIWCMVPEKGRTTELFVILGLFLPFYTTNNLENQNFEKMEKNPGDVIIFHKCTINENYMMHGSWDVEWKCLIIFSNFLLFYPTNNQKIKILKTWKKVWRYHVPKIMIIYYTVHEIWHVTDLIFIFHFELYFDLLPQKSPKNQNY